MAAGVTMGTRDAAAAAGSRLQGGLGRPGCPHRRRVPDPSCGGRGPASSSHSAPAGPHRAVSRPGVLLPETPQSQGNGAPWPPHKGGAAGGGQWVLACHAQTGQSGQGGVCPLPLPGHLALQAPRGQALWGSTLAVRLGEQGELRGHRGRHLTANSSLTVTDGSECDPWPGPACVAGRTGPPGPGHSDPAQSIGPQGTLRPGHTGQRAPPKASPHGCDWAWESASTGPEISSGI